MSFKILAYGTSCVLYPCIEEHYYVYVTNQEINMNLLVFYVNIIISLLIYLRRHCFRCAVFYVSSGESYISDMKSTICCLYCCTVHFGGT